jgi:hypothetical protein
MKMELLEWTGIFIDHMNAFKRDLESKKNIDNKIVCVYKQKGEHDYLVYEELDEDSVEKSKHGSKTLVCLNTKKNIDFVVKNWKGIISNQKLKIIFANPTVNMQWSIIPAIHNNITEEKTLKTGLKSIAESVPEA